MLLPKASHIAIRDGDRGVADGLRDRLRRVADGVRKRLRRVTDRLWSVWNASQIAWETDAQQAQSLTGGVQTLAAVPASQRQKRLRARTSVSLKGVQQINDSDDHGGR
jgi:hypothetical protein